ncbi:hypothetical protein AKJ09_06194 [Labilithrix luteola]|uniref:P/Homo B domain-containing protein n=1 Tax=Labilithrix luteola TaxID=1391654 RepID=A0A0K1Q167_9BACT|nr:fibrinogen-like YCDxxxxGGGW domain-containing protein [Labilithrix luteola]AKU99530.1 hypothetical protein AKJ09_06194 [Labilithrix luteola]
MNLTRASVVVALVSPFAAFTALGGLAACEDSSSSSPPTTFDAGQSNFAPGTGDARAPLGDAQTDATDTTTRTFKVKGTILNAANAGLVIQQSGSDDLTIAPGATAFEFATPRPSGSSYAVTIRSFPQHQVCKVKSAAGTVSEADVTDVVIDCANRASCNALLTDFPGTASGTYLVDPDGNGTVTPLVAQCDMTYDDGHGHVGGWTLLMSTNGMGPVALSSVPALASGGQGYLAIDVVKAIAAVSSQIHVRSTGQAATKSVTSTPNSTPITNLRQGVVVNYDITGNDQVGLWTGPLADANHLLFNADANAAIGAQRWPGVYWDWGGFGFHLIDTHSSWTYNNTATGGNEPMEVYVR